MSDTATRVVLSYPADLPDRAVERLERPYYRGYLAKTLGRVAAGDEREEFTDVGCCGSQRDVTLRVERVEGGDRVTADTAVEYTERAACGLETGWAVQNDAPTEAQQ
ncbi:MAG: hypothetical protein ABEH77_07520 [Halobacteriaceae archaeon]